MVKVAIKAIEKMNEQNKNTRKRKQEKENKNVRKSGRGRQRKVTKVAKRRDEMKKKWAFLLVLLVVVVGVVLAVVLINVLGPKSTAALANEVCEVVQDGYLSADNEQNQRLDEYLEDIVVLSELSEEKIAIENYQNAFVAFEVMGDFYNRQVVFTEYASSYDKQLSKIKKAFSSAESALSSLVEYLNQNWDYTNPSSDWQARTWDDCKGWVETVYSSSASAFSSLAIVYQDCVKSTLLNNNFTTIVFKGADEFFESISNGEEGAGASLLTFASAYMSQSADSMIIGYSYNESFQNQVADILEKWSDSAYYSQFTSGLSQLVA